MLLLLHAGVRVEPGEWGGHSQAAGSRAAGQAARAALRRGCGLHAEWPEVSVAHVWCTRGPSAAVVFATGPKALWTCETGSNVATGTPA